MEDSELIEIGKRIWWAHGYSESRVRVDRIESGVEMNYPYIGMYEEYRIVRVPLQRVVAYKERDGKRVEEREMWMGWGVVSDEWDQVLVVKGA